MYDIIVVGAGPAGLTAALYARRANKTVLVLEKGAFGGQITFSPKVENIPGFISLTGNEFADKLDIANVTTMHARAEEISRKPEYNGQFDLCVTRAVAGLDKLAGWCLPFVRKGGSLIAYKGENYETEVNDADKSLKKYKGKLERVVKVDNPSEEISGHVLLVIRKL
jgi:hypothetical protein